MKRWAGVLFAVLLAIGLSGMAEEMAEEETSNSTIEIQDTMVITDGGDLNFPDGSGVTDPGATGPFVTNTYYIEVRANDQFEISGTVTKFKCTLATGDVSLPTDVYGRARKTGGIWWDLFNVGASPTWHEITDTEITFGTHTLKHGYWRFEFKLRVTRDGFNDHAGTYEATVTVTFTLL